MFRVLDVLGLMPLFVCLYLVNLTHSIIVSLFPEWNTVYNRQKEGKASKLFI